MATYLELFDIKNDNDLNNRLFFAVVKKAQTLLDKTTPTANEVAWANSALSSPRSMGEKVLRYVLGANSSASTAAILAGTDTALQTNVDSAADAFIAGGVTS